MVQVKMARARGEKFVYLNLGSDRAGLFDVSNKRRIRMVHRVMKRKMTVRPRPWLEPAADKARRAAPGALRLELQKAITADQVFK
jgi:hypothetical protein